MHTKSSLLPALLICTAMVTWPSSASAQAAPNDGPGGQPADSSTAPGEIVVTAQKRAERLLEVPATVSAFTSERLQAANIRNVSDVSNNIPNVSISQAEQPGIVLLNVRGVGQVRNGEPPVAVVIDGVQLNNVNQFSQDLLDVERIEVLKGPQGAIYGRNAIGGAINIVTRGPTDYFTGAVQGTLGTGLDRRGEAVVSGPIAGDKLMFRLSGSVRDFDGDIHSQTLDRDVNQETANSVRLALLAKPSEGLSIDLRGSRSENHSGAAYYSFVTPGAERTDILPILGDIPGKVDRYLYDASAKIDYDLPFAKLTSISGYTHTKFHLIEDFDFLPADYLSGDQAYHGETWSQEVRLSATGTSFDWMVGAYLLKTKQSLDSTLFVRPGAGGVLFPFPIPAPTVFTRTAVTDDNVAYAGFGNLTYRPSSLFEASLGVRYDIDDRQQTDEVTAGNPQFNKTFRSFQPKLTLSYKPNRDLNFYASAGKGFRSGGFNPSPRIARIFKSEENVSFELGGKSALADGAVTLDGAVFYTRVKNRQIYLFDNLSGSQIITNPIPRSRIMGVEAELTARPVQRVDISLSGGLIDTKVLRYDTSVFAGTAAAGDFDGNDLPQVPTWSYNAAIQYSLPVSGRLELTPRVEVNGKGGRFYWEIDNRDRRGAVNLVNLRLTAKIDKFSITGFVENLFDKIYLVDVVAQRFSGAPLGDYNMRSYGRRIGVTARASF